MPNISTLQHALNLRLKLDAATPAIPSSRGISFKDSVLKTLTTQLQQNTCPEQQQILSRISAEVHEMSAEAFPSHRYETDVRSFITVLKQEKLHELNQELGAYFQYQYGTDIDATIEEMKNALANKRLPALRDARDTVTGNATLERCINEHIVATEKQIVQGETNRFLARFPDILSSLKTELCRSETQLKDSVAAMKNSVDAQLKSMVGTAIALNDALIIVKNNQSCLEVENRCHALEVRERALETVEILRTQMTMVLRKLASDVERGELPASLPEGAPAAICDAHKALQSSHLSVQSAMQRETGASERPPDLEKIGDRLRLAQQALTTSKSAALEADRAAYCGTGVDDFLLRIKRLFGAGKGRKTRTEYRVEQQKNAALAQEQSKNVALLRDEYAAEVQRLESEQHALHQTMVKLQHQETRHRTALLEMITTELENVQNSAENQIQVRNEAYNLSRDGIIDREDQLERDIRLLEADNVQLKRMLQGDPLNHIPALRKRFAGEPALKAFDLLHTQWLEATSADAPSRENLRALNLLVNQAAFLSQNLARRGESSCMDDIAAIRPGLTQFGIDLTPPPLPLDIESKLSEAATLFAMLTVEKSDYHPLVHEIQAAEAMTPRTRELLTSLEKRINLPGVIPEQDTQQYRKGQSPKDKLDKINHTIQGLRKVIDHDLKEILLSSADFTAQFFHPENQIYIDRQGTHGTCTMHSWNNIVSHITDNQTMMLTPWRMEKLIQSHVILSAHIGLSELLSSPAPSLAVTETVLNDIACAAEYVHPGGVNHLMEHGYAMSHKDDTYLNIDYSHLNIISPSFFNLMKIRNEKIDQYISADPHDKNKIVELKSVEEKNYDAISIVLCGTQSGESHAVALLKQENHYLLVDSNYNDPVPLTLPQLAEFINTGNSTSDMLDELMLERGYQEYKNLWFCFGLYKREIE